MNDLISIVIPVYKVERYLKRCVDTVLDQSYNKLEVILVDDGSPDMCGEICDEYAKLDKRIKVIHKKNGGLSDARNVGIDEATGRYIAFIDSDDWIYEKYVEKLHNLLKTRNADISVCNFIKTSTETITENTDEIIVYEYSNLEALRQLEGENCGRMIVAWGKLYKTELFKGIRFPVGKIHEDQFTTYKLLYKAKKIVVTTENLLYYWQRSDSIMGAGFKIKNKLHDIEALEERADFFSKIGQLELRDKTYKHVLREFMDINENIHLFEEEDSKGKYIENFNSFKSKLRNSKQSFKFKLFYESYFISPKLAKAVQIINAKIRGLQNLKE